MECRGQFRRSFGLDCRVDGAVERVIGFLDERAHGGVGQHLRGETALGKNLTHGAIEHVAVERHLADLATRESYQIRLIKPGDGEVEKTVMVLLCLLNVLGLESVLPDSSPPTRKNLRRIA